MIRRCVSVAKLKPIFDLLGANDLRCSEKTRILLKIRILPKTDGHSGYARFFILYGWPESAMCGSSAFICGQQTTLPGLRLLLCLDDRFALANFNLTIPSGAVKKARLLPTSKLTSDRARDLLQRTRP